MKLTTVLEICAIAAFMAGCHRSAAKPVRPVGEISLDEAQKYVVELVNYDRQNHGLEPVEWDDAAAKAGARHARDMASNGFTGHWGTDGSVPELRYTEAGGVHLAQENAACFFDAVQRELDPNPTFKPELLEQIESAFYNEKPPNDGHRKNILKRWHNKLGVGLAKAVGVDQPCMAQEFVDDYGDYDGLPQEARVGQKVTVAGELGGPVEFGGVGIARIDTPKPMTAEQLNQTSTYRIPDPFELFHPEGFQTRIPVSMKGKRFSIELELTDGGRRGVYEVSVWGKYPGSDDLVMTSLRTISVR